jgi:hypothetical protein
MGTKKIKFLSKGDTTIVMSGKCQRDCDAGEAIFLGALFYRPRTDNLRVEFVGTDTEKLEEYVAILERFHIFVKGEQ